MNCGTVLFDTKYQFPNGTIGEKLSIVLCEYGVNYLVAKTTSQPHAKHSVPGCQLKDKPPNFFIPANSYWFHKDTWVELDAVYELDSTIHGIKCQDGTTIEHNVLPDELVKAILDCALASDDIDEFFLEMLSAARTKFDIAQRAVPATPKPD
jgi:hypothetical protein